MHFAGKGCLASFFVPVRSRSGILCCVTDSLVATQKKGVLRRTVEDTSHRS